MKILSWNCKGLGKSIAILKCKKKALEHKPNLMFLMETRSSKEKGKQVWIKRGFSDGWEVPRDCLGEGLLLAWLPSLTVHIVFHSNNIIHANLLDA